MTPAITVEELGKQYQIHSAKRERYTALRDVLTDGVKKFFNRKGRGIKQNETFWALQDISFKVEQGEVLGIIGANGAGKSTLLKILSRITEPSAGRAILHGKVASLLEVGTGFHPELTGRENIYLSGAILGMQRSEIRNQFDEIVSFSGVETFLDTPVKRYSSGMRVRLGFAVAAHLQPEILLVDEVLAVGDLEFQKRCLGKMNQVAKGGKTILFVSHDLNQIARLCRTCLYLSKGSMVSLGETSEIVGKYIHSTRNTSSTESSNFIEKIDLNQQNGLFSYKSDIEIQIQFKDDYHDEFLCSLSIFDNKNQKLFISEYPISGGFRQIIAHLPGHTLKEGHYFITVNIKSIITKDIVEKNTSCLSFRIIDRPQAYYQYTNDNLGIIQDPIKWMSK